MPMLMLQAYLVLAALLLLLAGACYSDVLPASARIAGLTELGAFQLHTSAPGFLLAAASCVVLQASGPKDTILGLALHAQAQLHLHALYSQRWCGSPCTS